MSDSNVIVWWNATVRLMAIIVLLGCCSCAHSKDGDTQNMLIEVWTKQGWPSADIPAPKGFKVPPEEAFRIVAESKKLSMKHRWICFRDGKYYYIADAFGKSDTATTALKYGVKVNGNSGAIE